MKELGAHAELVVRQKKSWGEMLTGFEARNKYVVHAADGKELFLAGEECPLLLRWLLKGMRPLTFHILSPEGAALLRLRRPFRFFFSEMIVEDPQSGLTLGRVRRRFKILGAHYTVTDAQEREAFSIHGPFFRPWTFKVLENGAEAGRVEKKWSGLGKEMFTDADHFRVAFPPAADPGRKALLLGALFLIDLVHFER